MAKRYFYSCPIVALYMKKNFGVKFECKNEDDDDGYEPGVDPEFFPFGHSMLNQPDMVDELDFDDLRRAYVCKESEHIFEPKEGDCGHDSKHFFQPESEETNDK